MPMIKLNFQETLEEVLLLRKFRQSSTIFCVLLKYVDVWYLSYNNKRAPNIITFKKKRKSIYLTNKCSNVLIYSDKRNPSGASIIGRIPSVRLILHLKPKGEEHMKFPRINL